MVDVFWLSRFRALNGTREEILTLSPLKNKKTCRKCASSCCAEFGLKDLSGWLQETKYNSKWSQNTSFGRSARSE